MTTGQGAVSHEADELLERLRQLAKRLPPKTREIVERQLEDLEKEPPEERRRRAEELLEYLRHVLNESRPGDKG